MEKCFNIAGPCFPDEHYMLPALERLPGIVRIVEQRSYFVLHAARQSGKTTVLKALVRELNEQGKMNALYFTVESVQRFTDPRGRSWSGIFPKPSRSASTTTATRDDRIWYNNCILIEGD